MRRASARANFSRPIFCCVFFGRSIPIVSKRDYTHPAYNGTTNCGVGEVAWNTVAASPFAKHVSVNDWTELPALLDRLRGETDHYVDRLQVCRCGGYL